MDRKIQKIDRLVKKHLHQSKQQIREEWGNPEKDSDQDIWFYNKYRFGIFKDEIAFFFKENEVVDITITEYILWKGMRNIFYFEGEVPEYKVFRLL